MHGVIKPEQLDPLVVARLVALGNEAPFLIRKPTFFNRK